MLVEPSALLLLLIDLGDLYAVFFFRYTVTYGLTVLKSLKVSCSPGSIELD